MSATPTPICDEAKQSFPMSDEHGITWIDIVDYPTACTLELERDAARKERDEWRKVAELQNHELSRIYYIMCNEDAESIDRVNEVFESLKGKKQF